jgi:Domain of unknown function (DUF4349)
MQKIKRYVVLGLLSTIVSCNQYQKEQISNNAITADSSYSNNKAPVDVVKNNNYQNRQFIRTANMKFKVENVLNTTHTIEDITKRNGGFVAQTNLNSTTNTVSTTPISKDSSIETTTYIVENTITIRVPNTLLDSTLLAIAKHIQFIDNRTIKADDVSLEILSNNLTQTRLNRSQKRVAEAIEKRGVKLTETTASEEVLLTHQKEADEAAVLNLSLRDQVQFSTIHLTIYQRETSKAEIICHSKELVAYEPSFGLKVMESITIGWHFIEVFIVFIVKFWALFLLCILVYILYKKFKPSFEILKGKIPQKIS